MNLQPFRSINVFNARYKCKSKKNPKRVIFAEGEDENMLKAAIEFGKNKLGSPILIGAEKE